MLALSFARVEFSVSFVCPSFWMELKKVQNKAEMKERKKPTLHLVCIFADVGQSSCVLSSLPCFCTFLAPSLLEIKFYRNFFYLVPIDKLARLQALATTWCSRRLCNYKEWESLVGPLAHAGTVIRLGRIFCVICLPFFLSHPSFTIVFASMHPNV